MEIDNEPLIFGLIFIVMYSICSFDNISVYSRIISFAISGTLFLLLNCLGTMGGGDVKLMFVIGYFVGLQKIFAIIYMSFFIGAITGIIYIIIKKQKLNSYIPLGPSIAISTIISLLL